jgi:hypothetical protein
MAEVTIDDRKFETDDFNDQQKEYFEELKKAAFNQSNLNYQLELVNNRISQLGQLIYEQTPDYDPEAPQDYTHKFQGVEMVDG